jgi:hypothetical protein
LIIASRDTGKRARRKERRDERKTVMFLAPTLWHMCSFGNLLCAVVPLSFALFEVNPLKRDGFVFDALWSTVRNEEERERERGGGKGEGESTCDLNFFIFSPCSSVVQREQNRKTEMLSENPTQEKA